MKLKERTSQKLLTGSILDEQIALETRAIEEGVARYRKLATEAVRRGEGSSLKPAERLMLHWYRPLLAAVRTEMRAVRAGKSDTGRAVYGDYLLQVNAERVAVATLHEAVSRCMADPRGVYVSRLTHAIGRAVMAEAMVDAMKQADKPDREHARADGKPYAARLTRLARRRKRLTPSAVNWWAGKTLDDETWERRILTHLGARLLWLLIGTASVASYDDPFKLAFLHQRRWIDKHKSVAQVRLSDAAWRIIEDGHQIRQHLRPRYLPMVVAPYPWSEHAEGGYVRVRTPFIAKPTRDQKDALNESNLSQVYECLTAVNDAAWRINARVLDVVKHLWNAGGGVVGIPHRDNLPLPPKPHNFEDKDARQRWKRDAAEIYSRNVDLRGERCEFVAKLAIAEQFQGRTFWMPHQLDFRGRVYPIPPHLNHQGDDVCRGLLEFADNKAVVDDDSMYWLKVHAANCYGFDKASFDDRVGWTDEHLSAIRRMADDPIGNEAWHLADKPFQFLAACFALTDPDAASCLPVQLDGTCNGLQHYAALGRDPVGAAVVNLLPAGQPSDIYSNVAEAVRKLIAQDMHAGNEIASAVFDQIDRKVVKRPVMTSVYGVTNSGAQDQISEEINVPADLRYKASQYLARITLDAIGQVCVGARQIMDWLNQCGRVITQDGHVIRWDSPLGFPVVQPYRNWGTLRITTVMQRITMVDKDIRVPVAVGKQVDGFAPNFIHSLDATHMFMTARACHQQGIAFAAVHDSYWTHAATASQMGQILREQFVELHSQPILKNLHQQFTDRYQIDLPQPPESGDLDLHQVLNSPYFFS